ncbi:MAG: dihydrolipoyl dehydrogenase [Planctomycetota bacterium]
MTEKKHDLLVVGAGPGGYVSAIRAAQLGLDVGIVEKEPQLGGTCLRVGCIPSKALLESSELYAEARHGFEQHGIRVESMKLDLAAMLERKTKTVDGLAEGVAGLMKKNKITRYAGRGEIVGEGRVRIHGEGEREVSAEHILIATGSRVSELNGVELDGDRIATSTEALSYDSVPEHLVVIGAGAIGLELGSVWSRLGAKVTVLEYLDRILPGFDEALAKEAQRIFAKQGLEMRLGSRVTSAKVEGDRCQVICEGQEPIECDRVLVAVGRRPNTEGLGLESVGIETDERGRVPIDERFRTKVKGIYAIGDVVRGPMLAHKAEEEGVALAELLVTGYGHVDYDTIPNIVYTMPEVASVGRTEAQLKEDGVPYRVGQFPFAANGRARALGHTEGRVKILAHEETDRVLGVHILGPRAGDLIAEAAAAMAYGASAEDIARTCHAHPTLAEVLKEAALAVDRRALHS